MYESILVSHNARAKCELYGIYLHTVDGLYMYFTFPNIGLLAHLIDCLQVWTNVDVFYRHDAIVRQKSGSCSIIVLQIDTKLLSETLFVVHFIL